MSSCLRVFMSTTKKFPSLRDFEFVSTSKKFPSLADWFFVSKCLQFCVYVHVFLVVDMNTTFTSQYVCVCNHKVPISGKFLVCVYMSTTKKFPTLADCQFVSMCLQSRKSPSLADF